MPEMPGSGSRLSRSLQEAVEELAAPQEQEGGAALPPEACGPGSCSSGAPAAAGEGLLCALVWLHHLKSLAKRKLIVQWCRELGLAGACKPGFPGAAV